MCIDGMWGSEEADHTAIIDIGTTFDAGEERKIRHSYVGCANILVTASLAYVPDGDRHVV